MENLQDPDAPSGNVSDDQQDDRDVHVDSDVPDFNADENGLIDIVGNVDNSHDSCQEVSNDSQSVQPEAEDSGGSFRWWDELSESDRDEEPSSWEQPQKNK